ncbi:bcl-2-interacting killer isoform X1 [Etheostoma cragini]|uniref:bcl-2-interacting killer isoform X1 n=2 Tax=Etheostoma cragini TaxID=417921 RepID=UPI00155E8F0B|nr:bcl-2-interacting killer isoform X1 [Etheostoma cragini]
MMSSLQTWESLFYLPGLLPENKMVEQTREPSRVVSLQAGPGEVDTDTLFDVSLRINDQAARAIGQQLALIGDQMDREWTSRQLNWLPTPLDVIRPAQALTRTIYRDIHNQLWGFQGMSAAVKAWIESTAPGVSNLKPVTCTGWARGALVTVALLAAVTILGALWVEWKA